jgi:putative hydroxymethylpyrimidine transport system permease protein
MIAAGRLQQDSVEELSAATPTKPTGFVRRLAPRLGRAAITFGGLMLVWEAAVRIFRPAPWIVPAPSSVFATLVEQRAYLGENALVTFSEIGIGLAIGGMLGSLVALLLIASAGARRWLLPLVVASQALPVFAIAPLLVIWLGYGLASKIAMATLIIFFPVASAFFDGLRRTDPALLDLAKLQGAGKLATLRLIRVPAALPGLASGLRVAAAAAPIGAVVGEWVGASAGLGYVMLHANARMQTDLVFAALAVLGVTAALLWFAVDAVLARLLPWSAERG